MCSGQHIIEKNGRRGEHQFVMSRAVPASPLCLALLGRRSFASQLESDTALLHCVCDENVKRWAVSEPASPLPCFSLRLFLPSARLFFTYTHSHTHSLTHTYTHNHTPLLPPTVRPAERRSHSSFAAPSAMSPQHEGPDVVLFASFALLLGVVCRSAVVGLKLPIPYTVRALARARQRRRARRPNGMGNVRLTKRISHSVGLSLLISLSSSSHGWEWDTLAAATCLQILILASLSATVGEKSRECECVMTSPSLSLSLYHLSLFPAPPFPRLCRCSALAMINVCMQPCEAAGGRVRGRLTSALCL